MKKLSSILKKQNFLRFPVRGINGYGGEQDGSRVLFAMVSCPSKKAAELILIPDAAEIHWATYTSRGWEASIGIWSFDFSEEDDKQTPLDFC